MADITAGETIAEMASAVLERAPDQFLLAGFSLGTQVALEIMERARERVQGLALLSGTRGGLLPPVKAALENAVAVIEGGGLEAYLDLAYPTYVAPERRDDTELKQRYKDMGLAVGAEAGARQMRALLRLTTAFPGLERITCKTLVLGGVDDIRTTPAAQKELAGAIYCARLILLEGAGHFTPLEDPGRVTGLLGDWIAGCQS